MLIANPQALRRAYPDDLRAVLNVARTQENRRWLHAWSGLASAATPLYRLPDLAQQLGVAELHVKDESQRSPIASFKALGAPIALVRQILRLHPTLTTSQSASLAVHGEVKRGSPHTEPKAPLTCGGEAPTARSEFFTPERILGGAYAQMLSGYTVVSATDGNHGRALALAARDAGCRCVIVLHAQVNAEREAAIAQLGADIVRVDGNYDASVEEAARLAAAHGWQVISDTSYADYRAIPGDVMQGYAVIAAEVMEQEPQTYSHVFLQGGVGGLAAGVVSFFWEMLGEQRPYFVVVEPEQADCLMQSALQGVAAHATGTVDSLMAGLACGATSPLAWQFLQDSVDHVITVTDADAVAAMRARAQGSLRDLPLVVGESGAAGLAALTVARGDAGTWDALGLNAQSRVLVISTEGATAPKQYAQLVGESAVSVVKRQVEWEKSRG